MRRNTRFLAGSLASAAVASALTFATPAAFGAEGVDRPCGQPEVPATYGTLVREPVLQVVPALTHEEWRWQRALTRFEHEYSREVAAAHTETDWVRPGGLEFSWSLEVVDQEAVDAVAGTDERGHLETVVVTPAVTVTQFEYVQQQTGRTRWEDAGWNGEHDGDDKGQGWTRTGATREDVVTEAVTRQVWVVDEPATPAVPAVPEISHVELRWSDSSPGAGWTGPLDSRVVGPAETTTTTGDDVPAGTGWTKASTREVPAVVETVWAEEAPDGFTATGASRVEDVVNEETSGTSATAPAGDGWTQVDGSRVVVVDRPESTEIESPGSVEQVELSPAQPATEACAAPAPAGSQLVAATPTGESTAVAGSHVGAHKTHGALAPGAAQVLPEAGSPVSPLLLTAGLGSLLAGGVLVGVGRRRRTS
ncbi:hypothetical protein ACVW00_001325 [Marmoricola sp. URHA0025 HA25]